MGRQYCGICMCPYDDDGSCGCENPNETNCNGFCGEYECKENKENCLRTKAATNKECNPMGMNKPVAWMGTIHGVKTYFKSVDGIDFEGMIPLYTQDCVNQLQAENKELHAIAQRMAMAESDARKSLQNIKDHPAELTDEEIMKLWKGNVESCGWKAVLDFARAILRKAQEK